MTKQDSGYNCHCGSITIRLTAGINSYTNRVENNSTTNTKFTMKVNEICPVRGFVRMYKSDHKLVYAILPIAGTTPFLWQKTNQVPYAFYNVDELEYDQYAQYWDYHRELIVSSLNKQNPQ